MTIDVDASSLLAALDRLGDAIAPRLKRVARGTAEAIQSGAQRRLSAQTAGTGQTAAAITIEDIVGGYRVYVGPVPQRAENLPLWLEFGTKHMTGRPFLFAEAVLQEGAHLRRVAEALQDAVDEVSG